MASTSTLSCPEALVDDTREAQQITCRAQPQHEKPLSQEAKHTSPHIHEGSGRARLDAAWPRIMPERRGIRRLTIFDLPPELRTVIWELTLLEPKPIRLDATLIPCFRKYKKTYGMFEQPGLLLTCKTIRNEALAMFLGRNRFRLGLGYDDPSGARGELERLKDRLRTLKPADNALIRDIAIEFDFVEAARGEFLEYWAQISGARSAPWLQTLRAVHREPEERYTRREDSVIKA